MAGEHHLSRDAALYLRELDQLGSPQRLLAYLKTSPFRRVAFHANAERRLKTLAWAEVLRRENIRLSAYTTPGGLTPDNYAVQVDRLTALAKKMGADQVILDMEAPWRSATPDQVVACCRLAGRRGHRVIVTTVPGHPVLKTVARLQLAAIAVQVYDRRNTYSEARIKAICARARQLAPNCLFDLPAWNKTPQRLARHLSCIPACQSTRYWMSDNPGQDDLPERELLAVIAQLDPALNPS